MDLDLQNLLNEANSVLSGDLFDDDLGADGADDAGAQVDFSDINALIASAGAGDDNADIFAPSAKPEGKTASLGLNLDAPDLDEFRDTAPTSRGTPSPDASSAPADQPSISVQPPESNRPLDVNTVASKADPFAAAPAQPAAESKSGVRQMPGPYGGPVTLRRQTTDTICPSQAPVQGEGLAPPPPMFRQLTGGLSPQRGEVPSSDDTRGQGNVLTDGSAGPASADTMSREGASVPPNRGTDAVESDPFASKDAGAAASLGDPFAENATDAKDGGDQDAFVNGGSGGMSTDPFADDPDQLVVGGGTQSGPTSTTGDANDDPFAQSGPATSDPSDPFAATNATASDPSLDAAPAGPSRDPPRAAATRPPDSGDPFKSDEKRQPVSPADMDPADPFRTDGAMPPGSTLSDPFAPDATDAMQKQQQPQQPQQQRQPQQQQQPPQGPLDPLDPFATDRKDTATLSDPFASAAPSGPLASRVTEDTTPNATTPPAQPTDAGSDPFAAGPTTAQAGSDPFAAQSGPQPGPRINPLTSNPGGLPRREPNGASLLPPRRPAGNPGGHQTMIPAGPAPQQQRLEPTQAQMPPQSSSEAGDFDDLIQRKTQSSQQPTTAQLLFGPNRASSRPGGTITAPRPTMPVAARPPAQRPAMPTLGTQKYPRGAKPAVPMPGFPQRRIPSRPFLGATSRPPVIQQRRQPFRRPLRPAPASVTNPAAINNAHMPGPPTAAPVHGTSRHGSGAPVSQPTTVAAIATDAGPWKPPPPCAIVSFSAGGRMITMFPERARRRGLLRQPNAPVPQDTPLRVGRLDLATVAAALGPNHAEVLRLTGIPGPLSPKKSDKKKVADAVTGMGVRSRDPCLRLLWRTLGVLVDSGGSLSPVKSDEKSADAPADPMRRIAAMLAERPRGSRGFSTLNAADSAKATSSAEPPVWRAEGSAGAEKINMEMTLQKIQSLLLGGRREEACKVALDAQLWNHALVISAACSEQTRSSVICRMALRDLNVGSPLQTLYLMLAKAPSQIFSQQSPAAAADGGTGCAALRDWKRNLAMILANRTVGDNKVISAYGDKLWAQQGHPRAAHLCYLLAGTPVSALAAASSARIVTVGADHHKSIRAIFDPESAQMNEVWWYTAMLGNPKADPAGSQPCRLAYASVLADFGMAKRAAAYVDAIADRVAKCAVKKGSAGYPYSDTFLRILSEAQDRLRAVAGPSKSGFSVVGGLKSVLDSGLSWVLGSKKSTESAVKPLSEPTPVPQPAAPAAQTKQQPLRPVPTTQVPLRSRLVRAPARQLVQRPAAGARPPIRAASRPQVQPRVWPQGRRATAVPPNGSRAVGGPPARQPFQPAQRQTTATGASQTNPSGQQQKDPFGRKQQQQQQTPSYEQRRLQRKVPAQAVPPAQRAQPMGVQSYQKQQQQQQQQQQQTKPYAQQQQKQLPGQQQQPYTQQQQNPPFGRQQQQPYQQQQQPYQQQQQQPQQPNQWQQQQRQQVYNQGLSYQQQRQVPAQAVPPAQRAQPVGGQSYQQQQQQQQPVQQPAASTGGWAAATSVFNKAWSSVSSVGGMIKQSVQPPPAKPAKRSKKLEWNEQLGRWLIDGKVPEAEKPANPPPPKPAEARPPPAASSLNVQRRGPQRGVHSRYATVGWLGQGSGSAAPANGGAARPVPRSAPVGNGFYTGAAARRQTPGGMHPMQRGPHAPGAPRFGQQPY